MKLWKEKSWKSTWAEKAVALLLATTEVAKAAMPEERTLDAVEAVLRTSESEVLLWLTGFLSQQAVAEWAAETPMQMQVKQAATTEVKGIVPSDKAATGPHKILAVPVVRLGLDREMTVMEAGSASEATAP